MTRSVHRPVGRLVWCLSVCRFLKVREISLPCPYRSTCFVLGLERHIERQKGVRTTGCHFQETFLSRKLAIQCWPVCVILVYAFWMQIWSWGQCGSHFKKMLLDYIWDSFPTTERAFYQGVICFFVFYSLMEGG